MLYFIVNSLKFRWYCSVSGPCLWKLSSYSFILHTKDTALYDTLFCTYVLSYFCRCFTNLLCVFGLRVWGSEKLRVSGSGSVKKIEVVWIGVC